jgi:hypothetical protein
MSIFRQANRLKRRVNVLLPYSNTGLEITESCHRQGAKSAKNNRKFPLYSGLHPFASLAPSR